MQIPDDLKELLKNPVFKGFDINNLEEAINKTFDKDMCAQESLKSKDELDNCADQLTDEDRKKQVEDKLKGNDDNLPDDMKRDTINGLYDASLNLGTNTLGELGLGRTSSLTSAGKYINRTFNPFTIPTSDEKCVKDCIDTISKMVDGMREKTVAASNDFQKFDKHLSEYFASMMLLHNSYYSLLTFYNYKNNNTSIENIGKIIKKIKFTNSSDSYLAKYFISKTSDLIKQYREDIKGFDYRYSIFFRELPITIIEIGVSKAVRVTANLKLKNLFGSVTNQVDLDDSQVEYKLNNKDAEKSIVGDIMEEYGTEPSEDEAKNPNFVKNKQINLLNLLTSYDGDIDLTLNKLQDNAKKIGFNFYVEKSDEYTESFQDIVDLFIEKHNNMISILEGTDIDIITKEAKKNIEQLFLCGEQLKIPDEKPVDYFKDPENRTYSQSNAESDISSKEYWVEFTKYLNINALLPIYWRIGLIIPTPGGPLKIPLPIISIHLITIRIMSVIVVIWLTINGIVIVPTVYTIQFLPIADAASVWLVLFRGVNKKVKDKTGTEILNIPTVGGINVNPPLSKILPFKKDDLPTIERMSITNPLYLVYLNKMLSTMTPSMGLP